MNKFRKILAGFFLIAAVVCAFFYFFPGIWDYWQTGESSSAPEGEVIYSFLNPIPLTGKEPTILSEAPQMTVQKPSEELFAKFREAYAINSDVKGWLEIDGTKIVQPVVRGDDNEYYSRRGLDGSYSYQGTAFFDYRNVVGSRNQLDQNTLIYGHNTSDNTDTGEMFAQLLNYTDLDYLLAHPVITVVTAEDEIDWQIFACFYTDTEFYYINSTPNHVEFMEILKEATARSEFIISGVEVGAEDKILTLSTCTYKWGKRKDQRFVVMARMIPAGAPTVEFTAEVNPEPKPPYFVTPDGLLPSKEGYY